MTLPMQDAGRQCPDQLPAGAVVYYHTHGRRQYFGTCKLHRDPNCRYLVHWEPGYVARGTWRKNITEKEKKKFQLGKILMREWAEKEEDVSEAQRCRACWRESGERKGT